MNVAAWLHGLGLGQYEQAFRENDIDASVLARLTADDLIGIGVASVGHRRKLLTAIAGLRDGPTPTPLPVPSAPAATSGVASPLPEAERRQVTVLFADIAGYTKLADELDAEEVHALLGSFFDLADASVVDHGGTVDKHIGDCVMAVFGAPVAYGNDPERCVRAALDIGSRMPLVAADLGRPIGVHIGIASGEVMATGTGSARHVEYTVTGESVNLASRLKDKAPTGEIFISDSVYRALAERVDCSEVGELAIKGLAKPVRAWRLRAFREPARSSRQAFVGRHRVLRELEAALVRCRNTLRGRTIYIRGEAGIGKTRLLEQFRTMAEGENFACHSGLVLDFGMGSGQDAIRSLVRSLLGLSGESSQEEIAVAAAEKTIADGMLADERRVYLNDLLNVPQPTELRTLYDAMDNPARNRGKRATVAELVTHASGHRPLLLAIEDLHWADQMTLDHLANLAETVAGCPALLVMTSRLERDLLHEIWGPTIAGQPIVTIDLGPLQPSEANGLAEAYLGALGELAQRCVERADGNPLFLEQLLRHAEESAEGNVPGSIRSLVQARLDRLALPDKRALQAASVLGQRFTAEALAALLDQPGWNCAGLVRHLLVRPQGDHFLFAHALIQEGVYDTLLRSRRRELHRQAADWFRSRDLMLCAQHLDRGDDDGAPRAYLEAAGAQAAEYRTERALRLVERGVILARNRADLSALHLLRGEILHDLGSISESIAAFEQALAVADVDIERCRAWLGLAAGLRVTDRFDEAFAMLDKAATAAIDDLAAERARIHHLRGNLCFPLGRLVECLHEHERALDCARIASSPELEARALGGLGDAEYARGRMASAHRHFSRCVELSRASGAGRIEVANLSMVAHTQVYLNDFSEALATSQMAVELAARVGHHRAEIIAHYAACNVFRTTGEFARVKIHAERALVLARQLGAKRFEAVSLNDLAMVARAEASSAEAMDLLHRALMISRETGVSFVGPWILGHLAVTTEDPVELQTALTEGEDILRKGAVSHNHLWFFRYAIDASLHSQDWDGAERYSAALEDFTRSEPLPLANFFVRYGRTVCAHGRGRPEQETTWKLGDLLVEAERLGIGPALGALALLQRARRQQENLT